MTRWWLLFVPLFLLGCTTSPPRNTDDLCAIFEEKDDWYEDAAEARDAWGSPIPVMMAILHQESRFRARARPPRKKIFGFIPGPRPSDAYGYSQAKKSTWKAYERSAGRYWADRHDFADAIDFVGWYNFQSHRRNGISRQDSYRLYLAYHEGHGGYRRGSFAGKKSLLAVARKVERRAASYQRQLLTCEESLRDRGWFFGWF
ncbi:MAG: transglycosylase SLT domain-containing protein [Halioglobus sp.]|nr:transglycosylase SLT domain-containing protein [Halioglobus sp.]